LDQRGDLRADQEDLAITDIRIGVGHVAATGADRLDLPALQHQAGFDPIFQVEFVARALVQRDGFVGRPALCFILALFLAHFRIVSDSGAPRTLSVSVSP